MKIVVSFRMVDGVQMVFPACRQSMIFARIAGTKTLSVDVLKCIQDLGYSVKTEEPAFLFA